MHHLTLGKGTFWTFSLDPIFMPLNGKVGWPERTLARQGFTLLVNINESLLWHGARDSTLTSQMWSVATSSH